MPKIVLQKVASHALSFSVIVYCVAPFPKRADLKLCRYAYYAYTALLHIFWQVKVFIYWHLVLWNGIFEICG